MADQEIEMFSDFVNQLGNLRMSSWHGPADNTRLEYILSQVEAKESINLTANIKGKRLKNKIQQCLGYLSLRIWQVSACKIEPQSGNILWFGPPTHS